MMSVVKIFYAPCLFLRRSRQLGHLFWTKSTSIASLTSNIGSNATSRPAVLMAYMVDSALMHLSRSVMVGVIYTPKTNWARMRIYRYYCRFASHYAVWFALATTSIQSDCKIACTNSSPVYIPGLCSTRTAESRSLMVFWEVETDMTHSFYGSPNSSVVTTDGGYPSSRIFRQWF